MAERYYVTTPIYYVNDRPHIGHVYTTTVADVLARYQRLKGREVFFLTGTDEHAGKVVESAVRHGVTPLEWANRNAKQFREAFAEFGISNSDFIRTTEARHKERVTFYVGKLLEAGDIYVGEYEGWYDPSQEEYLPETKAREHDFKSPVTGQPLVKRSEQNYFFKLSAYQEPLLRHLEDHKTFVAPDARRNELIGRIRDGLHDVPVSRADAGGWGISMPGDHTHTIYVWIDALFNYLSAMDTDDRRGFWPADLHLIAKDILWFHAAIWPAMLMALRKIPGHEWVELPGQVFAHSFWIRDGRKMSKSLGNFVDMEVLRSYVERFGLDALRYFLASEGPAGTGDRDFSDARFIEVYNKELANVVGNGTNRVANMIHRYTGGLLPAATVSVEGLQEFQASVAASVTRYRADMETVRLDTATQAAMDVFRAMDLFIDRTQPFKLAKDPERAADVGSILNACAEAVRIGSLLLSPIMPTKMGEVRRRYGLTDPEQVGRDAFDVGSSWGQCVPGTMVEQREPLFARHVVES